jgi:hypothetical protein
MIRDLVASDLPAVLALNNAHAVEVNALSTEGLCALVGAAAHALVVDEVAAFLIALDEGTPAHGPNHGWFLARHAAFLYVDRVVVSPEARGRGHARRLYDHLSVLAGSRPLCCEVNIVPPNEASLAFHETLGFESCGEADDPRNGKRVRYLLRR